MGACPCQSEVFSLAGRNLGLSHCHRCVCTPCRRLISGYKCICPKLLMELSQAYYLRILNNLLKYNMTRWTRDHWKKATNGSVKGTHILRSPVGRSASQAKCACVSSGSPAQCLVHRQAPQISFNEWRESTKTALITFARTHRQTPRGNWFLCPHLPCSYLWASMPPTEATPCQHSKISLVHAIDSLALVVYSHIH